MSKLSIFSSGDGGGGEIADGSVTPAKLSFDPATQAELDTEAAARAAGDLPRNPDEAILALDPNSYWRFDQLTGNYPDLGSGGITATHVAAATRAVPGYRSFRAADVNADTALATAGDNYDFAGVLPYTIAFLHRPTLVTVAGRRLVTKGPNNEATGWSGFYEPVTGKLGTNRSGSSALFSDNAAKINEWTLGAYGYDGDELFVYLNGIFKKAANATSVGASTEALRISGITGDTADRGARGAWALAAIWARALSQDELDSIWEAM